MVDSEIIKAFRCCYLNEDSCEECPCFKDGKCIEVGDVFSTIKQVLDLINRQKAEIERLKIQNELMASERELNKAGATEAIKEFAERLKNKLTSCSKAIDGKSEYLVCDFDIDSLVKEMVGE